jgi:quercetin dioxygenase-like cupin family protein
VVAGRRLEGESQQGEEVFLMAEKTVLLKRGEGRSFWMLNGLYTVKASADETGGALTVMEMTIPAGWGPPPHTHPGTESVHVLEGRIRYYINGETIDGGPGSFFHIPEGTWERFEPLETSRLLVVYTPGGYIEEFFAEAGEPATANELPTPSAGPPDFERFAQIGARHGIQMRPKPEG